MSAAQGSIETFKKEWTEELKQREHARALTLPGIIASGSCRRTCCSGGMSCEYSSAVLNATHCRVTLIGLGAMGTMCSLYRDREAQKE